jgi:hypothetical protein
LPVVGHAARAENRPDSPQYGASAEIFLLAQAVPRILLPTVISSISTRKRGNSFRSSRTRIGKSAGTSRKSPPMRVYEVVSRAPVTASTMS